MKKIFTLVFILTFYQSWSQPCTPNTNSILFNGTSDYVAMPPNTALDITTEITVEAWIYPTAWGINSAQGSIICKHGWSSGEGGYVLRAGGSGELSFNIGGLDTNGTPTSWKELVSGPNMVNLNTWTHVAGTFNGDSLCLYINGVHTNTLLFSGSIVSSSTYDLKIGRLADNQPGIYRYWTGNIDEARVWNRALSAAEIAANMNTQIDPLTQTGLVGYWRLNDGSGTSITDLSTSNITGTLTGSGWSTSVPFTTGAPAAVITPSGNTTFCDGNSVILNATAGSGLTYLWSNGNTNQSITVNTSGAYTVIITDGNNCSGTSSPVTVTVNQAPPVPTITFNGSQLICSANTGIQWYFNGSTLFNQVGPTYTPSVNGSYTVIVTSNNGCTASSAPYVLTNLAIEQPANIAGFELVLNTATQTGVLSFQLMEAGNTEISIFDFQGRLISIIADEIMPAGKKDIQFDTKNLTTGAYFMTIKNNRSSLNRKFSVVQ